MSVPTPAAGAFARAQALLQRQLIDKVDAARAPEDALAASQLDAFAMYGVVSSDLMGVHCERLDPEHGPVVHDPDLYWLADPRRRAPPPTLAQCAAAAARNVHEIEHGRGAATPVPPLLFVRARTGGGSKKRRKDKGKTPARKKGAGAAPKKSGARSEDAPGAQRRQKAAPEAVVRTLRDDGVRAVAPFDLSNPESLPDCAVRTYFGERLEPWLFAAWDDAALQPRGLYRGAAHRYVWCPLALAEREWPAHRRYCAVVNVADRLEQLVRDHAADGTPPAVLRALVSMQDRLHHTMLFMAETGRYSDAALEQPAEDFADYEAAEYAALRAARERLGAAAPRLCDLVAPTYATVFHFGELPNFTHLLPYCGHVVDARNSVPYATCASEKLMMHMFWKSALEPMRVRQFHESIHDKILKDDSGLFYEWTLRLVAAYMCGYYRHAEPVPFFLRHVWYRRLLYRRPARADFALFMFGFRSMDIDHVMPLVDPMRDIAIYVFRAYMLEMFDNWPGLAGYLRKYYHGGGAFSSEMYRASNAIRRSMADVFYGDGARADRWAAMYTAYCIPADRRHIRTGQAHFDLVDDEGEVVKTVGVVNSQAAKRRPPALHRVRDAPPAPGVCSEWANPIHLRPEEPRLFYTFVRAAMRYFADFVYGRGAEYARCQADDDGAFILAPDWTWRGGRWCTPPSRVIRELALRVEGGATPESAELQLSLRESVLCAMAERAWREFDAAHGRRTLLHLSEFARYIDERQRLAARHLFAYVTPRGVLEADPRLRDGAALDAFCDEMVRAYCGGAGVLGGLDAHFRGRYQVLHAASLCHGGARCRCPHCRLLAPESDDAAYRRFQAALAGGAVDALVCSWPVLRLINVVAKVEYNANIANTHRNIRKVFWNDIVEVMSNTLERNAHQPRVREVLQGVTETERWLIATYVSRFDAWAEPDVGALADLGVAPKVLAMIARIERYCVTRTYPAEIKIFNEILESYTRDFVLIYLFYSEFSQRRMYTVYSLPADVIAQQRRALHERFNLAGAEHALAHKACSYYYCAHGDIKGAVAGPGARSGVAASGPHRVVIDPTTGAAYCHATARCMRKPCDLTAEEEEKVNSFCRKYEIVESGDADAACGATPAGVSVLGGGAYDLGGAGGGSRGADDAVTTELVDDAEEIEVDDDDAAASRPMDRWYLPKKKANCPRGRGPSAHSRSRAATEEARRRRQVLETLERTEPRLLLEARECIRDGKKRHASTPMLRFVCELLDQKSHRFKRARRTMQTDICAAPLRTMCLLGRLVACQHSNCVMGLCSQCTSLMRVDGASWSRVGPLCGGCTLDLDASGVGRLAEYVRARCTSCRGRNVLHRLEDVRRYVMCQDVTPGVRRWVFVYLCEKHDRPFVGMWSATASVSQFDGFVCRETRAMCGAEKGAHATASDYYLVDNEDRRHSAMMRLGALRHRRFPENR